jgi:hypothetical protein
LKQCRYIPEADLPPVVTEEQRKDLLGAFREERVKICGQALRWLQLWQVTVERFVESILAHLENERRVFQKLERGSPRILRNKFQASVWIWEPDDVNDYDDGTVYVEMILSGGAEVLIFDAHEHENRGRGRRLPQ